MGGGTWVGSHMHQLWTILQHDGRDCLGLRQEWCPCTNYGLHSNTMAVIASDRLTWVGRAGWSHELMQSHGHGFHAAIIELPAGGQHIGQWDYRV